MRMSNSEMKWKEESSKPRRREGWKLPEDWKKEGSKIIEKESFRSAMEMEEAGYQHEAGGGVDSVHHQGVDTILHPGKR